MIKNKLLAPLALVATFLLASCSSSTIVARPSWQDDKIIENVDTKDNKMKIIYDAIKGLSDTNSNVLNKILFEIAQKYVGTPEELKNFSDDQYIVDHKEDFKNFVNTHDIYKPIDKYKIYKDTDGSIKKAECTEEDLDMISFNMIANKATELKENIYEKLFEEIKGGSYSTDNLFSEERYVMNLRKNLYNVPSLQEIKSKGVTLYKDVELIAKGRDIDRFGYGESWEDYVNTKILHVTNLPDFGPSYDSVSPIYGDYINRKIIPDIYRTYLIQTYVREQRYSNLGRTYARKVNMITVANGGVSYKDYVKAMFNAFAKKYITNRDESIGAGYDFSLIEKAMRGIVGTNAESDPQDYKSAYELLSVDGGNFPRVKVGNDPLIWQTQSGTLTHVFKGTKLGDLFEKVEKVYDIVPVPSTAEHPTNFELRLKKNADMSVYNEITNTGAYSFEHGLSLKERDIRLTNYTKEGWYLKNGGLTDLNAKYRDNLFNIATSNIIDRNDPYKEGDYVKYYNFNDYDRKAFLTTSIQKEAPEEQLIVLDDGTNYMIIEVEDAVSTSKLSTSDSNTNSYRYLKASDGIESCNYLNDIISHVVKASATGDTYKNNANQYYLMISNILIHDQAIYDYFKSQYPDLFK